MSMLTAGLVILGVAFAFVGLSWVLPAWLRYRGTFIVACPDSWEPAGVKVDSRRVARSAWRGAPDVRLKDCSRWPGKAGCAQGCLAEVEFEADAIDRGRRCSGPCSFCGDPIPGALADVLSTREPARSSRL
jgi:hypothetical protein